MIYLTIPLFLLSLVLGLAGAILRRRLTTLEYKSLRHAQAVGMCKLLIAAAVENYKAKQGDTGYKADWLDAIKKGR